MRRLSFRHHPCKGQLNLWALNQTAIWITFDLDHFIKRKVLFVKMSVGVVRATCSSVDDDDGDDDGLVSSFSDCSEMSSLSSTTTEEFGTSNGGTVGSVTTDSGTTPEMKPMKPFSTGFDQICTVNLLFVRLLVLIPMISTESDS